MDLLWELFTDKSDPTHQDFVKPLAPNNRGRLELRFAGRVRSEPFVAGVHPHWSKVLDMRRRAFKARKAKNEDSARQLLSWMEEKYKIPYDLISEDVNFTPLPHGTSRAETFPNTGELGATAQDFGWTELVNGAFDGGCTVISGNIVDFDDDDVEAVFICDATVAAEDFIVQVRPTTDNTSGRAGPMGVMNDVTTHDGYSLGCRDSGGLGSDYEVIEWADGVESVIISSFGDDFVNDDLMKIEYNGTTVTTYRNGSALSGGSVTDSTLDGTGNNQGGIFGKSKLGTDNAEVHGVWTMDDGISAGAGIRNPFGGPMVLRNPLGA